VKLLSDYLNVYDHNLLTLQTDRRHRISIPRYPYTCFAR